MKNDDDDHSWLRQDFLDLVAKFGEFERQVQGEITEYRKTVNNAIGLLSRELLDFIGRYEKEQKEFIEKELSERKARQKRQDIKDALIVLFLFLTLVIGCSIIAALVYFLTQRVVIV